MSSVRPEDIEQVAQLAALEVDAEALPKLTEQIAQILEYVSQLDVVGAPLRPDEVQDAGAAHASPLKPLRPDEVQPADLATQPQSFAPAFMDGLFVVPRLSAMEDA